MFNDPLGNKQYTVRETAEGVRDFSKQGGGDLYSPFEKIAAWLDGVVARLQADMYGVTVYNDGSHDDLFAKVGALFNSSIRNIANSLGYEELPGTVLPEIHVSGRGLNWNDIWSKVQDEYDNYNGYDIGSRNWAATEKQLATKKDLGEYVYKAAEIYATGELFGAAFESLGLNGVASKTIDWVGSKLANHTLSRFASGALADITSYTRSTLRMGQEIHKLYKLADVIEGVAMKEFNEIPGIRPDFVNSLTRTIYELKPYNPNAIAQGYAQLAKYQAEFQRVYGGIWNTVLDTY